MICHKLYHRKSSGKLTHPFVWKIAKLFIIRGTQEKNLAPWLCAHSVAGFPFLAAWSVWVSPKHALSHFTHFLPDDLSISVASEHIHCALENGACNQSRCQNAHRFTEPYVCLSPIAPSICSGSDACPYVSACDSACVGVCIFTWHMFICVYLYIFFLSTEEYNTSIQEKLPLIIGSAAAGLVFLIAVVVIIIVCNRWVSPDTEFIKLLADIMSEQACNMSTFYLLSFY